MAASVKNTIANLIRNTSINAFFKLPEKTLSVDDYFLEYYATYSPPKTVIYPAAFKMEAMPRTIHNEISTKFAGLLGRNIPEASVFQLKNGKVYGMNAAVIAEEDVLLRDVSREFGKRKGHSIFERLFLPRVTKKNG